MRPIAVSTRSILLFVGALVGAVVGLWLLTRVWDVLLLLAVALVLAAALMPAVEALTRRTGRRGLAVVLVTLAVLVSLLLFLALVLPPMVQQGRDVWDQAPELRDRAARFADERGWHSL